MEVQLMKCSGFSEKAVSMSSVVPFKRLPEPQWDLPEEKFLKLEAVDSDGFLQESGFDPESARLQEITSLLNVNGNFNFKTMQLFNALLDRKLFFAKERLAYLAASLVCVSRTTEDPADALRFRELEKVVGIPMPKIGKCFNNIVQWTKDDAANTQTPMITLTQPEPIHIARKIGQQMDIPRKVVDITGLFLDKFPWKNHFRYTNATIAGGMLWTMVNALLKNAYEEPFGNIGQFAKIALVSATSLENARKDFEAYFNNHGNDWVSALLEYQEQEEEKGFIKKEYLI